ncbi:hypothetical protein NDU88_005637 [Pleurodeles waltl]|uniref:Uncharacterized protein n=1 Tax=Pleurodeles waltl TaxID=8319 RepID=A0AAV7LN78_PLEWA|nr:hypothetical protein NDU88_005637 [Pleurodeles waltl]
MLVQRCRASFQEVKKHLRAHGSVNVLIFPVKLKAIYELRSHFFDSPMAARDWLDQNFQGTQSDQQQEFTSQNTGRWPWRARRKQDSVNNGEGGQSPRQVRKRQLEAIQLATTLWDPNHRSSMELSMAGDSDTETEGSVALFPTVTPQTASDL